MTDVVFAFGPDGYFFESQTQWRMKDLPQRLQARFTSGSSDVAHVHHLVLGAGESWFMSYRTKAGGSSFAHDGLPEKLAAWLRVKDANGYSVRDIRKLRISLGPYNASFWAEDGRDYFWDNLPGPLQMALEKLKSPQGGWARIPRIVVLGINQSYVMMSEGGGGSYAVSDYYPWLEKELVALVKSGRPGALKSVHHISMDQHDGHNFVMTTVDGQVYYYVPDQLSHDLLTIRATIPRTPASDFPPGREAETGSNPMPLPQAVSVPSAGPNPYSAPEEAHSQGPSHAAAPITSNVVHTGNQHNVSPSSFDYTQAPAPPYSPAEAARRASALSPDRMQHGQVPAQATGIDPMSRVGSPQTLYPHGAATGVDPMSRVGSPQTLYQHPQVTALEQAAATTRIVSPVNSISTGRYSHEALQYGINQRIMSPAPGATHEQPAIVSHTSSEVVSPVPGHQSSHAGSPGGVASISPQITSQAPSGQLNASQIPGSPSPITQPSASPVYAAHGQNPGNVQGAQNSPAQPVQHIQNMVSGGTSSPFAGHQSEIAIREQGQQSVPSTPAPPEQSLSPAPGPASRTQIPLDYNVPMTGSLPASTSGSIISQASNLAAVPVVHTPGPIPAWVDSVPIPATSTPVPPPAVSRPAPQLVSVPVNPTPTPARQQTQTRPESAVPSPGWDSRTYGPAVDAAQRQSQVQTSPNPSGWDPRTQNPAEVSASPPPHRQSIHTPVSPHSSASHGGIATPQHPQHIQQQSRPQDTTALPGAVPFMPPAQSATPVPQPVLSPATSPAPLRVSSPAVAPVPLQHSGQQYVQPYVETARSTPAPQTQRLSAASPVPVLQQQYA